MHDKKLAYKPMNNKPTVRRFQCKIEHRMARLKLEEKYQLIFFFFVCSNKFEFKLIVMLNYI